MEEVQGPVARYRREERATRLSEEGVEGVFAPSIAQSLGDFPSVSKALALAPEEISRATASLLPFLTAQ